MNAPVNWFNLTGDERINLRCATDGCGGQPTYRLEADGVGSNYCSGCRARIMNAPVSTPVADAAGWRTIDTFDFDAEWFKDTWYLIATSDGRRTVGKPFMPGADTRAWVAGSGNNCSDPRWPNEYLPNFVTHWQPLPPPPESVT